MCTDSADPKTKSTEELDAMIAELDELMKRSLLEMGMMEEIEARVKEISLRIARLTPRPDPSVDPGAD